MTNPADKALREASRRRDLVLTLMSLLSDGYSQNQASRQLRESAATLSRYRRAYAKDGIEGLLPKHTNSGRKPDVELTDDERRMVQQIVIKSDPNPGKRVSVSFALRVYAHSDACRDAVRDVILKPRKSKHTLTPTLKKQARVRVEDKQLYRGPKTFTLESFTQPRDLTYVDERGEVVPLMPGVCFEGDDMHINEPFWVEWNDPADKCAARYGVRAFRAQLIPWLDVGAARFVGYSLVLRYSDAYRAKDLRWSLNHLFHTVGVPKILRLEMGAWASHDVESIAADARVCKITHATGPKSKFIENRFNQLQKCYALHGMPLGRKRGEFEEGNKLWMRCRQGTADPRKHFMGLNELVEKLDAGLLFINADPLEGDVYGPGYAREYHNLDRWSPDSIWQKHVAANPLRTPSLEETWRLQPEIATRAIHAGMARVRCDEIGAAYHFHHERFAEMGTGWKVKVCFDPARPDRGAAIINAESQDGARNRLKMPEGELIGIAEYVDRVPQFNLSDLDTDKSSFERRARYTKLCRLLYREIMPFGVKQRTASTAHHLRDGRGEVAEVSQGSRHVLDTEHTEEAQSTRSSAYPVPTPRRKTSTKPRGNPLLETVDY